MREDDSSPSGIGSRWAGISNISETLYQGKLYFLYVALLVTPKDYNNQLPVKIVKHF